MAARGEKPVESQGVRFLDFKAINLHASCSKISEVLERSDDDGINPDDLDDLKRDLLFVQEILQKRCQDIAEESEALAEYAEKPSPASSTSSERKKSSNGNTPSVASLKRREPDLGSRLSVDAKRVKSCASESSSSASSPVATPASSQSRKPGAESSNDKKSKLKCKPSKSDQMETELQLAKVKLETSNKFWSGVDQFCSPITESDIKAIRQAIAVPEEDQELYKVPPLGRHYSFQWAQEDISGDGLPEDGVANTDKDTKTGLTSSGDSFLVQVDGYQLPHEVLSNHSSCSLGPLTQRLVSALIEDKKTSSVDTYPSSHPSSPLAAASPVAGDGVGGNGRQHPVAVKDMPSAPATTSSSLHSAPQGKPNGCVSASQRNWMVSNTKMLETRIHQELVQLGLMDPEEAIPLEDEDDDVLAELRRRQSELKAVAEYNRRLKAALLERAEIEHEKQLLQEKVNKADAEVVECLKKVTASKQRKKPLTRKEREAAFQTLSHRASLVKRLNQLDKVSSGLFSPVA